MEGALNDVIALFDAKFTDSKSSINKIFQEALATRFCHKYLLLIIYKKIKCDLVRKICEILKVLNSTPAISYGWMEFDSNLKKCMRVIA